MEEDENVIKTKQIDVNDIYYDNYTGYISPHTYIPYISYSTDFNKIDRLEKQIERMAKFINKIDIDEEICKNVKLPVCEKYCHGNCHICIEKYFEKEEN